MTAQHGTYRRYKLGCTEGPGGGACAPCKAANTAQARQRKARRTLVSIGAAPKPVPASNEIGENEAAVIEQCANMPKAAEKPAIVAQSRTLAKILDDPVLQPIVERLSG
jgi:hypothetical protein